MHRRLVAPFLALLILWSSVGAAEEPAAPLVDAAWLAANLGQDGVAILDIRAGGAAHFAAAHIPGAVHSDYRGWRTTNADGTPGMLPPVPTLEAKIGDLGIDNATHVVIVAHGANAIEMASATRVYWTFKVLGHDAVSVLDGGMAAYAADPARPLEAGTATPRPATFVARFRPTLIATKDDVANAAATGITLVDNRPGAQYAGDAQHPAVARAGTIPGARNTPQPWFIAESGRFREADALAEIFAAEGVPRDGPIACFCNTGHMASMGWFVAYALLGNTEAKLYDGSMIEWAADAAVPMVKPAAD